MKLLPIFLLTFTMFGQQVVTWTPEMDHAYINGHFQFRASSDSAAVKLVAVDSRELDPSLSYIIAAITIENRSAQRFDVFPSNFSLALLDPKRPPKPLDNISPEAVVKAIRHQMASSAFWSGFGAGMAKSQQTTTTTSSGTATATGPGGTANGTYSGTTTTTQTAPNTQAQQQIAQNQAQYQQSASDNIAAVNQIALRTTTLETGQEIKGVVFFKRDSACGSRSGCNLKMVFPIGQTTFEFPVQLKKRS